MIFKDWDFQLLEVVPMTSMLESRYVGKAWHPVVRNLKMGPLAVGGREKAGSRSCGSL